MKSFRVIIMILFFSGTSVFSEGTDGTIEIPVTFKSYGSWINGICFTANARK